MNTDFLKSLTILYVEDEEMAREQLGKSLSRLFKQVILANNGEEGLKRYHESLNSDTPIDVILSDINMPVKNGIEMLEAIRSVDMSIPFMFITARSEVEYLLKAIDLNVHYYAIKPINIQEITKRIETICEKRYLQAQFTNKSEELEHYIQAINSVAVIYKMNTDGQIICANDLFLQISDYSHEDLATLTLDTILHPDVKKKYIKETWRDILTGNIWRGTTKYITKNGEEFYLSITIFKVIQDNEKDEFVTLGFVTTTENIKQREFHKKVMLNLKEQNQKTYNYVKTIEQLQQQISQIQELSVSLEDKLHSEKQKNAQHQAQIKHYETTLNNKSEKTQDVQHRLQRKIDTFAQEYDKMKKENQKLILSHTKSKEELESAHEEIKKLYEKVEYLELRVEQTKDLLNYREGQLSKIDPHLLKE